MGKICWINGQPYSVGLPTGGMDKDDRDNQWDKMIDFLGEDSDSRFHWRMNFSWCENTVYPGRSYRASRGLHSARYWYYYLTSHRFMRIGFRPVLMPLNAGTLEPDPSLLEDIPDGERIALASLYVDGNPVLLSNGNGAIYKNEGKIILGDRSENPKNWLYVIKHEGLLWADQNVLINISWDELRRQGYVD